VRKGDEWNQHKIMFSSGLWCELCWKFEFCYLVQLPCCHDSGQYVYIINFFYEC
jgi:hypothetical protein